MTANNLLLSIPNYELHLWPDWCLTENVWWIREQHRIRSYTNNGTSTPTYSSSHVGIVWKVKKMWSLDGSILRSKQYLYPCSIAVPTTYTTCVKRMHTQGTMNFFWVFRNFTIQVEVYDTGEIGSAIVGIQPLWQDWMQQGLGCEVCRVITSPVLGDHFKLWSRLLPERWVAIMHMMQHIESCPAGFYCLGTEVCSEEIVAILNNPSHRNTPSKWSSLSIGIVPSVEWQKSRWPILTTFASSFGSKGNDGMVGIWEGQFFPTELAGTREEQCSTSLVQLEHDRGVGTVLTRWMLVIDDWRIKHGTCLYTGVKFDKIEDICSARLIRIELISSDQQQLNSISATYACSALFYFFFFVASILWLPPVVAVVFDVLFADLAMTKNGIM